MPENSNVNSFELTKGFGSKKKVAKINGGATKEALEYLEAFGAEDRPKIWCREGDFSDLSFLRNYGNYIEEMSFSYVEEIDWETLGCFPGLRRVSFDGVVNTKNLEPVHLKSVNRILAYWSEDLELKISKLDNLHSLEFRGFGSESLAFLEGNDTLKHLDISNSRKLKQLGEVPTISKLDLLWLDTNSQLTDVTPIGNCSKLKTLCVTNNNKGYGYESIANVKNLEELILNAKLESLSWVESLSKLRILRFDCELEDASFDFINKMKSLEHVFYPNRRIYKTRLEEIEKTLKKRGYDPNSTNPDYGLFRSFPSGLE